MKGLFFLLNSLLFHYFKGLCFLTWDLIFVKLIKYQAQLDEHRGIAQLVE